MKRILSRGFISLKCLSYLFFITQLRAKLQCKPTTDIVERYTFRDSSIVKLVCNTLCCCVYLTTPLEHDDFLISTIGCQKVIVVTLGEKKQKPHAHTHKSNPPKKRYKRKHPQKIPHKQTHSYTHAN